MICDGSDLCCCARFHRAELLIALGVPQLVESHVENNQELETSSDETNGDVVHRHHLRRLVLDHVVQELVQSFGDTETAEILSVWILQFSSTVISLEVIGSNWQLLKLDY